MILTATGVVEGEFGLSEAYESKAKDLEAWLDDDNEQVRTFATQAVKELKAQAEAERKRAEEEIELRKIQYGES